ncbi:MAG TPA: hypothetical protein VFQ36_13390 [Ktedonobacteraceae bacterium]|nr:hypothetical protein [Ktedonobacteraceae bacterium]
MSDTHRSEVAAFRERQALEEEAARQALYGFAGTASHQMITARMQRGAERILFLVKEGKHDEAQALMNTEYWQTESERGDNEKNRAGSRKKRKHNKRG